MARSRAELMEEISRIDSKINELLAQMPAPPRAQVVPFPWGFWILAIAFTFLYVYNSGALLQRIHPILYNYRLILLVAGILIGVMAIVQTFRSMTQLSGGGGKYKHINKRIEQLRRERGILAQQVNQAGRM